MERLWRSEVSQSSSLLSLCPALRSPPPSPCGECRCIWPIVTRMIVCTALHDFDERPTKKLRVRTRFTRRETTTLASPTRARPRDRASPIPTDPERRHAAPPASRRPVSTPYSMLQHLPISLFTLPRAARRTVANATNAEAAAAAAAVLSTRSAAQHPAEHRAFIRPWPPRARRARAPHPSLPSSCPRRVS